MTILRAHFDGRTLVPDEPVSLPKDKPLEIEVRELDEPDLATRRAVLATDPKTGLPVFHVPPGTKIITTEEVQRELDEP